MLEKLRFNFIALNMALATLVLVVVFSAICHLEHQSSVSEVLDELEIALDRSEADASPAGRPLIGKHPDEEPAHLPIAVYRIGEDGDYAQTGVSNATISEAVIEIACREAASSEAERGHLGEAASTSPSEAPPRGPSSPSRMKAPCPRGKGSRRRFYSSGSWRSRRFSSSAYSSHDGPSGRSSTRGTSKSSSWPTPRTSLKRP